MIMVHYVYRRLPAVHNCSEISTKASQKTQVVFLQTNYYCIMLQALFKR